MGNKCSECRSEVVSSGTRNSNFKQLSKVSTVTYTFGKQHVANDAGYLTEILFPQQIIKIEFSHPQQVRKNSTDSIPCIEEATQKKEMQLLESQNFVSNRKMRKVVSEEQFETFSSYAESISDQQIDTKMCNSSRELTRINSQKYKYLKWDGRMINKQLKSIKKDQEESQKGQDLGFQSFGSSNYPQFSRKETSRKEKHQFNNFKKETKQLHQHLKSENSSTYNPQIHY